MTKQDLYRYFRLVHGWLSALAFVALCFFAFTGLLLNHPDWMTELAPEASTREFPLSVEEVAQLRGTSTPAPALASIAAGKTELLGAMDERSGGDLVGEEIFVRLQGVRGTSFLRANLAARTLEVTIESAHGLTTLNELHRAERAGKGWRVAVDAVAVVLIVLSLTGYLIFWSMRGARFRTAIVLTIGSTFGLFALFVFAVS